MTRSTTSRYVNGNNRDRRRRREWLVETYRADVDLYRGVQPWTEGEAFFWPSAEDWFEQTGGGRLDFEVVHLCRCYRCGKLLTVDTLTVDRIIPGCQGGTYRRNNIRPGCGHCNSETGGALGAVRRAAGARTGQ